MKSLLSFESIIYPDNLEDEEYLDYLDIRQLLAGFNHLKIIYFEYCQLYDIFKEILDGLSNSIRTIEGISFDNCILERKNRASFRYFIKKYYHSLLNQVLH